MTQAELLADADEAARRFAAQIMSREEPPITPQPPKIETTEQAYDPLLIKFQLHRNFR